MRHRCLELGVASPGSPAKTQKDDDLVISVERLLDIDREPFEQLGCLLPVAPHRITPVIDRRIGDLGRIVGLDLRVQEVDEQCIEITAGESLVPPLDPLQVLLRHRSVFHPAARTQAKVTRVAILPRIAMPAYPGGELHNDEARSGSGLLSDGRGWFRTTDLSRVKRGPLQAVVCRESLVERQEWSPGREREAAGYPRISVVRALEPVWCPFADGEILAGDVAGERGADMVRGLHRRRRGLP